MPNNIGPTEELSNSEKKEHTKGATFKLLMVSIIMISIILILLVSFLKIIWKADTSDQMMDKKYVEDKEKENK